MEEGGRLLALLEEGAMFFKLRATAGTTVGEGEGERSGEDGERCWWGDGVRDEAGCCRGRGVRRDLQRGNEEEEMARGFEKAGPVIQPAGGALVL